MLDDAILRWATCAGFTTAETCRLLWSDLGIIVGLYLITGTALSFCSRWGRALQILQARSFTPTHVGSRERMSMYPDDDLVVASGNRDVV